MARQSTRPVAFSRSTRRDEAVLMSSGMAGVVIPLAVIPLLREDSASGTLSVDINLAEMPKPLLNAVFANAQAWFVPKSAFPQFAGSDEYMNSYTKTTIKALGQADRQPPNYFTGTTLATADEKAFLKTMGVHVPTGATVNADWIDAFNLVYNFRLAAHSSKLPRKQYVSESAADAAKLPPAFWPSGRFAAVVADYEKALLIGQLDLDLIAGKLPIRGLWASAAAPANASGYRKIQPYDAATVPDATLRELGQQGGDSYPVVYADALNEVLTTSLADIDKARTTQAFAKMRTAMAGNDTTGFMSDEMILAHLMQGIAVPPEYYRRPWLLGSQRVPFGFAERHATDGQSLDQSVTTGRTSIRLPINVPTATTGGYIVVTLEVLPERLDERQSDEALLILDPFALPNALRDVQRTEPVDVVLNRRLDTAHTAPTEAYGYEPMNNVWNRSFTRLGGIFWQETPAAPPDDSRAGIWQANVVDPVYNEDHFLAPTPFPHDVFSDTTAPAFELVVRHSVAIVGNTQIGDLLVEDNNDYDAVEDGGLDDGIPG